jgi:hypothetical protein
MQECETGTDNTLVKRVTVRSGGSGHAHSGVTKVNSILSGKKGSRSPKRSNGKIVTLGR